MLKIVQMKLIAPKIKVNITAISGKYFSPFSFKLSKTSCAAAS